MSVKTPNKDLSRLDKDFRQYQVEPFLKAAPQVFVTEAWRSAARQKYLFDLQNGSTFIDGYNIKGMHQKGLAIDIAFDPDKGNELYPSDHSKWEEVAKIAKQYGMEWGYDLWSHTGFIDKPHFQDAKTAYPMPPNLPDHIREGRDWGMEVGITNGERPLDPILRGEFWLSMKRAAENDLFQSSERL